MWLCTDDIVLPNRNHERIVPNYLISDTLWPSIVNVQLKINTFLFQSIWIKLLLHKKEWFELRAYTLTLWMRYWETNSTLFTNEDASLNESICQ